MNQLLSKIKRNQVNFWLLSIAIIAFLFGQAKLANLLIIAMVVFWLIDKDLMSKIKNAFNKKATLFLISYFILTVLGLVHSYDLSEGFKFVEMRLLILLLPVVIVTVNFNEIQFKNIKKTFVYGCVAVLIFGLFNSTIEYWESGDSGFFFNDNLTSIVGIQAAYFAIIVNVSIILAVSFLLDNYKKYYLYPAILFLITCELLLATRISILTLALLVIIFMVYLGSKYKGKTTIPLLLTLLTLFVIGIMSFPQTYNRFKSMFSSFEYQFDNPNPVNHFNAEVSSENWNGLTLRLALWECGWEVIKTDFWLGVGTGDYESSFNAQLEKVNFKYAQAMNFGVHNQYLYTWISFGLFGLIIFIASIMGLFVLAYKNNNYVFILVLGAFCMAFLTENVLNRYYGILPFALLLSIIFYSKKTSD
ncbi:O-antigen ligase family protein [Fulvivirga lutea]|uniref:O-antigen ligase family protein n=1 Tax=Fulvivirga lutea TaxID=2810512 RepID=A0A974WH13_9BACT|nr:O-antigen ligase family protein [Fulvivirga lutea]QSE98399.1 O-antigen ligase family protein [Fulvivirga lutea]